MSSEERSGRLSQFLDVTDYVANGSFASLKENVEYSRGDGYAVLVRLVDHNANWQGDRVFVDESAYHFLSKSALFEGDIVIANVGANAGTVFRVPALDRPKTLGPNAVLVRPKRDMAKVVSNDYLYFYLISPAGQAKLKSLITGSAQPKFNKTSLRGLPLEFPSLVVQRAIAELMTAIDDRITLLRETNATLEAIAQALFKSWFVDYDPVRAKAEGLEPQAMDAPTAALFPDSFEESELGLVPKGWRVVRLGDVTERITKGTTPTTLKRPFVESGINFVKVESLTDDGQLLPDKFAYIDDDTHRLLARSQLKSGDVLVTIAGTIGRVAVMTDDFLPANTNQAVALVRPDSSKLPSAFVNQFLRLSDSKSRMGERVVQAVQANLSLGSLSDMKLVMPPPELVTKLHNLVFDCVGSKKHSNQQRIRTLTQLRDTLLPRLISGQLRLPEAETLLEDAL